MHRERTNRRITALEQKHAPEPSPVTVFLSYSDGTVKHGGVRYASIGAALATVAPHDYIIVTVTDCSKPATKAKG